jgi:predicted nucleic acid-binding protein
MLGELSTFQRASSTLCFELRFYRGRLCAMVTRMDAGRARVVLDTNVFVAAEFNPGSHSARLVEAVRDRRLRMVWDDATRTEVEHVMRQIPRLSWARIADLFRSEDRFSGATHPEAVGFVPDPADRKFAALAEAAQAPLVTSDAGLLNAGAEMSVPVLKPSEFARRGGL